MKKTLQKRFARFAGLLVLMVIVAATSVQAAQARRETGSGSGGGTAVVTSAQLQGLTAAAQQLHRQGSVAAAAAATALAGTQGRGGVNAAPSAPTSAVQPAPSRTVWIVTGAVLAALLIAAIVAWTLVRRRRGPGEFAPANYCELHPEDPTCSPA